MKETIHKIQETLTNPVIIMKKSFILIWFMLIATISHAQLSRMSWFAKAGMTINNWSAIDDTRAKAGFKIGGGMEYALTDRWSWQNSLFLVSKGTDIRRNGTDIYVEAIYLEMPMVAAARFNITQVTNIQLSAGPYIAYGIGGKTKFKSSETGTTRQSTFGDFGVRRFDLGVDIGATIEYYRFLVGLEGQYGVLKTRTFDSHKPKNLSFALLVGYKFH